MSLIPYFESLNERYPSLLGNFHDKKVFIAGHTGLYGKWLVELFQWLPTQGVNVTFAAGSRSNGFDITRSETFGGPPRDQQMGFRRPKIEECDYVFHCAVNSDSNWTRENEEILIDTVVNGTRNLMDEIRPEARTLYVSSGAVYNRESTLGDAKRLAERIVLGRKNGKVVRPFATVGPHLDINKSFAVSTFIRQKLASLPLTVTNHLILRSFSHMEDMLAQILHVILFGDDKPYDVGSPNLVNIQTIAFAISDNIIFSNSLFPSHSAAVHTPDLSRIHTQFGITHKYSSIGAVLDTLRWHQEERRRT